MDVLKQARVSADTFLDWVFGQDGRYELVDGVIVEMMAGARQGHNVVVSNIVMALGPGAKRRGCRTTAGDTAVRTGPHGVRFPDVVVDCGPPDPAATVAASPTLVVEVSSPGTSDIDTTDKLEEYQRHETIRLILLVDPGAVSAKLYRRDGTGRWNAERFEALDRTIDLPEVGAALALADIYDTLSPRQRPPLRLIGTGEEPAAP